jgi:predicted nucleotidyltransferase component of viral defense system
VAGLNLQWQAAEPVLAATYRELSAAIPGTDFYLAGGTALALQEGHRISIDLDLMSPTFDDPEHLIQKLQDQGLVFQTTMTAPRTLYVKVGEVQVSFLGYHYPLLEAVLVPGQDLLPLAHRDDIAAMKLAAIASRGSRKDLIDLWILVSRHRPLPQYLELYRAKYETRDVGHVVRSLTFFDDADEEPDPRMLIEVRWDRVKADFLNWVTALLPK